MAFKASEKAYFFCGIGGSGMLPLAALLKEAGANIIGSDRSYDKDSTLEKFSDLQALGIGIVPQDGLGITGDIDVLVVSSAVESSIPDVKVALEKDITIITRGQLLAQLFNASKHKIAVAGTSGKSTVTGMIGTILVELGQDPTIVNGGEIRNLNSSIRKGRDDLFIAEMDESDGSIAHYNPSIALLNNIALDHKTMEELEQLFGDYLCRSSQAVIVNYDQPRVKHLCEMRAKSRVISYGIDDDMANLVAYNLEPAMRGITFTLNAYGKVYKVEINVAGRHNVENALAALSVIFALELDIGQAIKALESFKGIHRRMEYIGTNNEISVFDDFAHNPDKISASLQTLKSFDGRLIVMFQPHGFGPLRLMGAQMVDIFAKYLGKDDYLLMPEAYYAGGTVDRSVTAKHLIGDLTAKGVTAHWFAQRTEIPDFICDIAKAGDRIVIMGARDDSLHVFAHQILGKL